MSPPFTSDPANDAHDIPPLYGSYVSYVPSSFRSRMTETVATLREVALMARDITPVVPAEVAPTTSSSSSTASSRAPACSARCAAIS